MDNSLPIEPFLEQFFTANHCQIIKKEKGVMSVKLTMDMDKALMNRPFYWQYVEATGSVGEPKTLTFVTDYDKENDGEWVHFGSPRFEQIYEYLKKTSKFTHLYEKITTNENTMLHPWLVVNFCIKYEGKQKKEELLSIGLNLINGTFILDMMERLNNKILESKISDHCYTITPLIKLNSGYLRIENYIDHYVESQTHDWAITSLELLREEIAMIHHFYKNSDDIEEMEKEIEEIEVRLQPKIVYEIVNGGMIHLHKNFHEN